MEMEVGVKLELVEGVGAGIAGVVGVIWGRHGADVVLGVADGLACGVVGVGVVEVDSFGGEGDRVTERMTLR